MIRETHKIREICETRRGNETHMIQSVIKLKYTKWMFRIKRQEISKKYKRCLNSMQEIPLRLYVKATYFPNVLLLMMKYQKIEAKQNVRTRRSLFANQRTERNCGRRLLCV